MSATLSFRHSTDAQYDYSVWADGQRVGFVWKVPGFNYGKKVVWKATNLTGSFTSEKCTSRLYAAGALMNELESRETVAQVDRAVRVQGLKAKVRTLAHKLVDMMISDGLVASEVAALRNELELATHELESALREQASQPEKRLQDGRKATLTAASVARYLNRNGVRVSSPEVQYRREGVFCRQSGDKSRVSVHIDMDMPGHRQRVIDDLMEDLGARYDVELRRTPMDMKELADGGESVIITVTKKA